MLRPCTVQSLIPALGPYHYHWFAGRRLIGTPFQSYYSASKHALEGLFKSVRLEVKAFNIQVSVIEPGFFKTNLNQSYEYAQTTIADYDKARTSAVSAFSNSIDKHQIPLIYFSRSSSTFFGSIAY